MPYAPAERDDGNRNEAAKAAPSCPSAEEGACGRYCAPELPVATAGVPWREDVVSAVSSALRTNRAATGEREEFWLDGNWPNLLGKPAVKAGAVLVPLLLLLKAYAVSGYSLTTTGALLTAAPLSVLLGTMSAYLYLALMAAALGFAMWLVLDLVSSGTRAWSQRRGVLLALTLGALLLSPASLKTIKAGLPLLLPPVLVVAVAVLAYVRTRRQSRVRVLQWGIGLALLLLVAPTLPRPWVPAEVLVLPGAGIPPSPLRCLDDKGNVPKKEDEKKECRRMALTPYPVVYVLNTSDGWTTVLHADTRYLGRVRAADIRARAVCHHESQLPGSRPLLQVLLHEDYESGNVACGRMAENPAYWLLPLVGQSSSQG